VKNQRISLENARQIDLVDFLGRLGHFPVRRSNSDFWYLSPLRTEKNASFKINNKMNVWFDHGMGIGGDFIDFGMHYFKCTFKELLSRLSFEQADLSLRLQESEGQKKAAEKKEQKIIIADDQQIKDPNLLAYLRLRKIPLLVAERFCSEIEFELYGRRHKAIGFKNNSGGYELRNASFKISSSPKDVTTIGDRLEILLVFEGFFDFLSFQALISSGQEFLGFSRNSSASWLILNSLAFFEKSRKFMEGHPIVHLFLDRDEAGLIRTKEALGWSDRYVDSSIFYHSFKDLNDFLIFSEQEKFL
jgi:hypothetical protein